MACIITYNNKKYSQSEFNEYFKSHFFEFAGNFLGNKQDIEGFRSFVANQPTQSTLESRVPYKDIVNRYLRTEFTTDFVKELLNDPNFYTSQSPREFREAILKKIIDKEVDSIGGRKTIRITGNRIYHVADPLSKFKYTKESLYNYAVATAKQINGKYQLISGGDIAFVRQTGDGKLFVELSVNPMLETNLLELLRLDEADIQAEIDLTELYNSVEENKAGAIEKMRQGNELIMDGDVLAFGGGTLFQRMVNLNHAIRTNNASQYNPILNKLVSKFPGVTWQWDYTISGAGKIDMSTGTILFNPDLMKEDTPWHEFGHILVRAIKLNNPEVFEKLKNEVKKLHEQNPTVSAYSFVKALYPDYQGDKFWEEVITTELGYQSVFENKRTGLYKTLRKFYENLLKFLGLGNTNVDTLGALAKVLTDDTSKFDFYPNSKEISDYMMSRVIPPDLADALVLNVKTDPNAPNTYQPAVEQIKLIANAISDQDFVRMLDTNKYFTSQELRESTSIVKAGEIFKNNKGRYQAIITKEDVAEAVLDFRDYFQYLTIYFQAINRHLEIINRDPDMPPGKKLSNLHQAYRQALVVQKHLNEFTGTNTDRSGVLSDEANTILKDALGNKQGINNNEILKQIFWLKQYVNNIIESHGEAVQEPVIQELTEYFEIPLQDLTDEANQDIDNLIKQLGTSVSVSGELNKNPKSKNYNKAIKRAAATGTGLDFKYNVTYTDGTTEEFSDVGAFSASFNLKNRSASRLLKRIQTIKSNFAEQAPTKENIKKFFSNTNNSWFAGLDVATTTKNPITQMIATYLASIDNRYRASLSGMRAELMDLFDEVKDAQGGGQFLGSIVDIKSFYKGLYREVPLYEVVNGKLNKDRKVLALNTQTDTIGIRNRMTELMHTIQYASDEIADLDPNDVSPEAQKRRDDVEDKIRQAEFDLKDLKNNYTERPFTDEYYAIQELLPEDIRVARNEIFEEMEAIRNNFTGSDAIDELNFELLRQNQRKLDEMESFFTAEGKLKPKDSEGYRVALVINTWKNEKRTQEIVVYPDLSEETKDLFNKELARRKQILVDNLDRANTPEERQEAYNDYNRWAEIYTRTIYTQQFYDERQAIVDDIQELLGDRGPDLQKAYELLFNLLKGKKDRSGQYMPNEVSEGQRDQAKKLEEEIESIKGLLKAESKLDKETKELLGSYVAQLQDLQESVPSKYYEETVENIKATIRSKVAASYPDLSTEDLEKTVHTVFTQSDWYEKNHIIKTRWDKDREELITVREPIFMWRVTRPNNPDYINKEAPSFYWYSPKISDKFKNPNFKPGETTFKEQTSGPYHNPAYNSLSDKQKTVLNKIRQFHLANQEGIYGKDRLGDVIPGVAKETSAELVDTVTGRNNLLKSWAYKIKSYWSNDLGALSDEEYLSEAEELTDAFGDPLKRQSRRLFLRYSKPLDLEAQSYDILTAIGLYGADTVRFKNLKKYQSTVLSMEETLIQRQQKEKEKRRDNPIASDPYSVVSNLIDRQFYGRLTNRPNHPLMKTLDMGFEQVSKFAGMKALAFNAIRLPINWLVGYKNNYAQAQSNGLSYRDYAAAYKETFGLAKDYFRSHSRPGRKPLRVQLIDFFGGTQSSYISDFRNLSSTGGLKQLKFWNYVGNIGDWTEYDIAAQTTFAVLNKYNVVTDVGDIIKLKDAFELVNGVLQIKPGIKIDPRLLQKVRDDIRKVNYRTQGAYDILGQPTVARYALMRQLLFLKKWMGMHYKTEWGTSNLHYGAGRTTMSANLAFMRFLQESMYESGKFWTGYKNLTKAEKAGVNQFGFNFAIYTALTNMIVYSSLSANCEDDGDADWKDYACLLLKKLSNEAEGVFTIWGMNEFLYTYSKEEANGVGLFEKIGWSIFGPVSVVRKLFDFDSGLYSTDPYYKFKPNSNKIDWDRTHPTQAGRMGLAVLGMDLIGAKGLFLGLDPKSIEYQNRAFNNYMPKTYTKELRTEYNAEYEGISVKPRGSEIAQAKAAYKKAEKEITRRINAYQTKGRPVPPEVYDDLADLQEQFAEEIQRIQSGESTGYSPTLIRPFFSPRPGLDKKPTF